MLGYAKTIVLTSGTSETLPVDFNPGNNVVACLGAGAASFGSTYGGNNYGGGGAAYAAKFNVPLLPNSICRYSLTTGSTGGKDQFRGIDTAFFGTIAGLSLSSNVSAGGTVLTFGSLPSWIVEGMAVYDATTPLGILNAQYVASIAGNSVTLSAAVSNALTAGDQIYFDYFTAGELVVAKGGNPNYAQGGLSGGLGGQALSCIGAQAYSGGNATTVNGGGAAGPNGAGNLQAADGGTVTGADASGTEFDSSHGCGSGGGDVAGAVTGGLYGGGGSAAIAGGAGAIYDGAQGLVVIAYNPAAPQAGMLLGM